MNVRPGPSGEAEMRQTVDLLGRLRVSFVGLESRAVHRALVRDAAAGLLDCRVATEEGWVLGLVLAAPSSYWTRFLIRHPLLGARSVLKRLRPTRGHSGARSAAPSDAGPAVALRTEAPARSWHQPGDAWRIVFVGTAPEARGRGVAAALYRAVMADRTLVARVALDNAPSLRLHEATGWTLYRDGGVALAVHVGVSAPPPDVLARAAEPPAAAR